MALPHEDHAFLPTGSNAMNRLRTDSNPQPFYGNENRFDIDVSSHPESLTKGPERVNRHGGYKFGQFPWLGRGGQDSIRQQKRRPRFFWWFIAAGILAMLALVLALGLVFGLKKVHATNASLTVDLGYSKYVGFNGDGGVDQWWGIRYAAPPTGDLRFAAPADPIVDGKTYDANQHGAVCHTSPSTSLDSARSEDCLFLDIFAPSNGTGNHPVFVYFLGGGFNQLSGTNRDGSPLVQAANMDMVVVSFNYRVGVYGFLPGKEVQANGTLNAGLMDQRKVLEWIQKHISKFGGNPEMVTIGGSSAGGASVDLHLSAYGGRDDKLFVAAAAQSQSFGYQMTVAESQYQFDALSSRVGCNTSSSALQCLRDLPIKTLASNNLFVPTPGGGGGNPLYMYGPVIDGNFTTDYTYNLFAQGKFIKVPVIFGDDTNEGTIFTPDSIADKTQMNNFLKNNFPKLNTTQLSKLDDLYPEGAQFSSKGDMFEAAANAYGEMRYICPGIYLSSTFSSHGVKSYNYHWDVLTAANKADGMGVTHTSEDAAIWGVASNSLAQKLSPTIQSYWVSFIRSGGDPNAFKLAGSPEWGTFNATTSERLHFPNDPASVAMETVPSDQQTRCIYLTSIGGANGQ